MDTLHASRSAIRQRLAALRQAMLLDPKAQHPSGRRARAVVGRTVGLLKAKKK